MEEKQMIEKIVRSLDLKKSQDIRVIKVADLTILANYFVIATGTSSTQVKALADEVDFKLAEDGIKPTRVEGYQGANWIILDYSDIIVHIFHTETRNFYSLERLWQDGENIDISEYLV